MLQEHFWEKALPTAIGALIGGLVTLGALVLKEWLDRRRVNQVWYEQRYITEGIDQLIVYVSALASVLSNLSQGWPDSRALSEPYPREAVERFRALFPDSLVQIVLSRFRDACEQSSKLVEQQVPVQASESSWWGHPQGLVVVLRDELLCMERALLEEKITRKAQVHTIRERKRIKPIIRRIDQELRKVSADFKKLEGGISATTPQ